MRMLRIVLIGFLICFIMFSGVVAEASIDKTISDFREKGLEFSYDEYSGVYTGVAEIGYLYQGSYGNTYSINLYIAFELDDENGTGSAKLIAGSKNYWNYGDSYAPRFTKIILVSDGSRLALDYSDRLTHSQYAKMQTKHLTRSISGGTTIPVEETSFHFRLGSKEVRRFFDSLLDNTTGEIKVRIESKNLVIDSVLVASDENATPLSLLSGYYEIYLEHMGGRSYWKNK